MSQNETFKSKLIITIVDKLILAALLAVFGFWLDGTLQNRAAIVEYQKAIYEKREASYIAILDSVKNIDRDINTYFNLRPERSDQIAGKILVAIHEYSKSGSGLGATPIHPTEVLRSLEGLDKIVTENNIYLPKEVILAIQDYELAVLDSMQKEIKQSPEMLDKLRQKSSSLEILIKQRLGVEDVVSG